MDVFQWSMPFVIEKARPGRRGSLAELRLPSKVTEMLYYILQPAAGTVDSDDDSDRDLERCKKGVLRSASEAQAAKPGCPKALPTLPDSNWVNHRARPLGSSGLRVYWRCSTLFAFRPP